MTDVELIKKKLAFIKTCVRELVERADPARLNLNSKRYHKVIFGELY